ncbi:MULTISPECIES: hypothetical protein [Streptomyces]|uniref:hypothetical protein n=1 Tax=Streptomyces evansiae TaxID=3075535 RepID=UPI00288854AF|nr:hypothetical protein [Streptomyces sp. DSM 41859]MDT0425649.1 hypothetical protein [Streptomyces sp. DSM 41859]
MFRLRWWSGAGEYRYAKVYQLRPTISRGPLEAVELGHRGVETDLESFDLAEPAVPAGFGDALAKVLDDLDEAGPLAGVHLENRAANAGVFVLAGGAIGAHAGAERDLAELKVLLEVVPLRCGRLAILLLGRSARRRSRKPRQVRTRSSWKTARYAWVVVSVS